MLDNRNATMNDGDDDDDGHDSLGGFGDDSGNDSAHDDNDNDGDVRQTLLRIERGPLSVEPTLKEHNGNNIFGTSVPAETSISIRWLAWVVLAFLLGSHVCLLSNQCLTAPMKGKSRIRRGRYRVSLEQKNVMILERPTHHPEQYTDSVKFRRDILQSGDLVETLEGYDGINTTITTSVGFHIGEDYQDFVRIIFPTAGFLSKTTVSHLNLIQYYYDEDEPRWCQNTPLIYQGWWPNDDYQGWWPLRGHRERQYLFAPTALIVAQCLWNAMQVFQLFLLLALGYDCYFSSIDLSYTFRTARKNLIAVLVFSSLALLPFSVYVISLGGHIFAGLTGTTTLVALLTPVSALCVSLGEDHNYNATSSQEEENPHVDEGDNDDETNSRPWLVVREETLACFANLCSHMYNGRKPWWNTFAFVDHLFGCKNGGDVTPKEAFYMGRSNTRIPLFVSQANHSSTSARVFLVLWSILPFLYVSYFGIMYLVAVRSPGVKIQRAICLFGIINFLFCTDVVAYKYGRGYRSPHEDIFHWWEHFAWRAAILLPLYQHCTNGHWKHRNYPVVGNIFRIAAASYGIFFLFFQVLQCDVVQFVTFLTRAEEWTFFELMGWEDHRIITWLNLNTPKSWATMIMTVMYFALHFSGFALFQVRLRRERSFYERL